MEHLDAYTEDGGATWRWKSNGQYCPLDTVVEHGIPCHPVAQEECRSKQVQEFLVEYRARMANRTSEQIAEADASARAAFGPGVELVNVVTGRTWTT